MKIPLASLGLRQKDISKAVEVLNSGNLTMGRYVQEFETRIAEYLGVRHFVMVNSGSSANLAIIEALLRPATGDAKLAQGDRVLVPAIAWPTTVWPLVQLGLRPYFIDVELDTLAIDLQRAQEAIDNSSESFAAMFPIHPLGFGIDSATLNDFTLKNDLVLINDVCESLGSFIDGQHSGLSGLAASFSFYFSHHLTTMEGGGIATNDVHLAEDLKSIRSHGWSRDRIDKESWNIGIPFGQEKFLFVTAGYNIRPMEIQAAIGISQLSELNAFIDRRRNIARRVYEVLKGSSVELLGSSTLISESTSKRHSWMHLPLFANVKQFNREKTLKYLESRGIETRPVLTGNFLSQPALSRVLKNPQNSADFSNASLIADRGFLIGCHHELSDNQVDYLCEVLHELLSFVNE